IRLSEPDSVALVRQALAAQEYWRVQGLRADVVILNDHAADYLDETHNLLKQLLQEPRWAGWVDKPGGIFLLRSDGMPEADRHLLAAVAVAVRRGDRGEMAAKWHRPARWLFEAPYLPIDPALASPEPAAEPVPFPPLLMPNGYGGFNTDGREYVVSLEG